MTTDLAAGIRAWLTERGLDPDEQIGRAHV